MRVRDLLLGLKHGGPPKCPAHQAFAPLDDVVDFGLRELVGGPRQIGELRGFDRLHPQRHLVDDAAEPVTRTDPAQEVRIRVLARLLQIPARVDPLHARDVRADLAELDPVERVFRVAARGRSQGHVADLDVQHELELLLAEGSRRVDVLQAGFRRDRSGAVIDPDHPRQMLHAHDRPIRHGARRQRVVAAHGPHWTRELARVAQNRLNLLRCFRRRDLPRRGRDTAVVIGQMWRHRWLPSCLAIARHAGGGGCAIQASSSSADCAPSRRSTRTPRRNRSVVGIWFMASVRPSRSGLTGISGQRDAAIAPETIDVGAAAAQFDRREHAHVGARRRKRSARVLEVIERVWAVRAPRRPDHHERRLGRWRRRLREESPPIAGSLARARRRWGAAARAGTIRSTPS